jgi:2-oxoglutarate dehydrogenase E1 component
MNKFSFLGNFDPQTIEAYYQSYLQNPESVDASWQQFFRGFDFALANFSTKAKPNVKVEDKGQISKEFKVISLIEGYRQRGHFFTKTNPVRVRRKYFPTLDIENFGLDAGDLDTIFQAGEQIGIGPAKLRDIVAFLEETYCRFVGVEYLYIRKPEIVEWLKKKMEKSRNSALFTPEQKKDFYYHLKLAVGFEQFIHKRFVGQKRFSLEGAEALIPAMDAVIERGAELGIEEFIIGMAHRGRLNVLANILKKPYENVFQEFIATEYDDEVSQGDVKYHLGYGNTITTDTGKKVRLNLVPNPSHLETVGGVVEGIAKAKIYHKYEDNENRLAPILIHGDAAIAAQGIVYEVIQMSQLTGYKTGGTIHLVINNQVGFTTNYLDARSSTYCTDIAKVTRCPVFHVNGDEVEALAYTIQLAMEYRQKFHTDVFIDILCYRRYGHNEGDEPRFTQPTLYKAIAKHPNPRDYYGQKLLSEGIYTAEGLTKEQANFDAYLDECLAKSQLIQKTHIQRFLNEDWASFNHPVSEDFWKDIFTAVSEEKLRMLAEKINHLPENHKFFSKIEKLVDDRRKMVAEDRLDWAMGEMLAYGSLLEEGFPVRISGQDCERGTFSHRHAAFVIEDTDEKYFPLKNLSDTQAPFHVYNSLLSEYGVLGFEYGYALSVPNGLTIWEAQFGDFHNVAMPIIDQYISSAEEKWGVMNGLVMLLPHGYEGQGPEHSSARIERFLILSAANNMQVMNLTSPANLFHAFRRQMHREFRLPMIIFTPKSLLRQPKCVSKLSDFSEGKFQEVIDDDNVETDEVRRVVFCSGKIYYDLLEKKQAFDAKDIALVRVEQLHPFPLEQLNAINRKYKNALLHLWVQEEPENMGPWRYVQNEFKGTQLVCVSRMASGSPAVGLNKLHQLGQQEIIGKVFKKCTCDLKNVYCGLQCVTGQTREEILKQHYYL